MIEEIITKQYKTKDSKLFDSKEEAEKYEEVLEFFNYFKDFCVNDDSIDDSTKCKCEIFYEKMWGCYNVIKCTKYEDSLRCRLTFMVRYYDDLKKFFNVDDLQKQIKYLTEQNAIQSEAIRELEDEVESLR